MTNFNWLMLAPCVSSDVMETPLRAIPESKKSFLPSLSEKQKVGQLIQHIFLNLVSFLGRIFDIALLQT